MLGITNCRASIITADKAVLVERPVAFGMAEEVLGPVGRAAEGVGHCEGVRAPGRAVDGFLEEIRCYLVIETDENSIQARLKNLSKGSRRSSEAEVDVVVKSRRFRGMAGLRKGNRAGMEEKVLVHNLELLIPVYAVLSLLPITIH